MSSIASTGHVISVEQPLSTEVCCALAITVLVLYDYLLTVSDEIQYVWMNKTSTATVIYYLNRYIIIFMALVDAVGFFPWRTSLRYLIVDCYGVGLADTAYAWSCENIELLYATLEIMWYGVWAAFSCLRVYAISGRDWRLAACALAFGLVPCGTNLFVTTQTDYSVSLTSFTGVCNTLVNLSTATSDKLVIITRVCLIISDLVVIISTWYYTHKIDRTTIRASSSRSAVSVLLREGTLYFVLLLAMNVLQITLFVTEMFPCTVDFIIRITAILLARYIIRLRQLFAGDDEIVSMGETTLSSEGTHSSILHARNQSSHTSSSLLLRHKRDLSQSSVYDSIGGWKDFPDDWLFKDDDDSGEEASDEIELGIVVTRRISVSRSI